jgi:hypothetical protein
VIYIDTEVRCLKDLQLFDITTSALPSHRIPFLQGSFQPERLEGICTRFNVDYHAALDNIFFCRAYNSDQLVRLLARQLTLTRLLCWPSPKLMLISLSPFPFPILR